MATGVKKKPTKGGLYQGYFTDSTSIWTGESRKADARADRGVSSTSVTGRVNWRGGGKA